MTTLRCAALSVSGAICALALNFGAAFALAKEIPKNTQNHQSIANQVQSDSGPVAPALEIQPSQTNHKSACEIGGSPDASDPSCRNAVAAEIANRLTNTLVLIGGIQCLFLAGQILTIIVTIIQSRAAIRAAIDSVVVSQKTAKAAEEGAEGAAKALAHAQESSLRQLRAYICVSDAQVIREPDDSAIVSVAFKNFGQTPAYDVTCWCGSAVVSYPTPNTIDATPPISNEHSRETLGPDDWRRIATGIAINYGQWQGIASGMLVVVIVGEIAYQDAFGDERRTPFRYCFKGAIVPRKREAMYADRTGNHAT